MPFLIMQYLGNSSDRESKLLRNKLNAGCSPAFFVKKVKKYIEIVVQICKIRNI